MTPPPHHGGGGSATQLAVGALLAAAVKDGLQAGQEKGYNGNR
jgi:hypothetical protein